MEDSIQDQMIDLYMVIYLDAGLAYAGPVFCLQETVCRSGGRRGECAEYGRLLTNIKS